MATAVRPSLRDIMHHEASAARAASDAAAAQLASDQEFARLLQAQLAEEEGAVVQLVLPLCCECP